MRIFRTAVSEQIIEIRTPLFIYREWALFELLVEIVHIGSIDTEFI